MEDLSFRQVHLDFHTSEKIEKIGANFSKEQFQKALKIGHVSSITVFSKCHHGFAYHPSKANEMHPHLGFDLLSAQIDAAHEIGVKTPVYLSAGLDEKMANRHPEWLFKEKDGAGNQEFLAVARYHRLCFNTPYLDYLLAQIDEVAGRYDADGIFLDIVGVLPCTCSSCIAAMLAKGQDPRDEVAIWELAEEVYANYTKKVREVVDKTKQGLPVFHNGGHIRQGRRDLAQMNTHLELESLPTGGWGYDHFPLSARYAQTLGMPFLGMTGKFHTTWGEFGGYKHKNALRYEAALSIANGACCSVGDQLSPDGLMDVATYLLIGAAYSEVEKKQPWVELVQPVADIALLTTESVNNCYYKTPKARAGEMDSGAVRILLEGHYLFNVIDTLADFSVYRVIILPDGCRLNASLLQKLETFITGGGKILATGESGLALDGDEFVLDFGAQRICENPFQPDYFRPHFSLTSLDEASFIFYGKGQKLALTSGKELGARENPYFNRDALHFCSHQHAPSSGEYGGPGMVEGRAGIYIAWNVFEDYATKGSLSLKETVIAALDRLLDGCKTIKTTLPAQGVTTLMHQKEKKRYIHHLLYACPVKRGKNVEVIEDLLPIYNTECQIKLPVTAKKVYLAPSMQAIDFTQEKDTICYAVEKFSCHEMVVVDYQ